MMETIEQIFAVLGLITAIFLIYKMAWKRDYQEYWWYPWLLIMLGIVLADGLAVLNSWAISVVQAWVR